MLGENMQKTIYWNFKMMVLKILNNLKEHLGDTLQ